MFVFVYVCVCMFVCVCVCVCSFVCVCLCFVFVFVLLFYVGTHLARGYSSGDPRNHYNTHTHTVTHNTITSNHKQSSLIIHTHTLCGQWQHFFSRHSGVQGWV